MKNIKTMTNLEPEVFATSISNINHYINRLIGSNKKAPVSNATIERIQSYFSTNNLKKIIKLVLFGLKY